MKYHKLHVSLAINMDIYDVTLLCRYIIVNDNSGYAFQNVGNQVFFGYEFSLFFVRIFCLVYLSCTVRIIIKLYQVTYNKTILMDNTLYNILIEILPLSVLVLSLQFELV